MNEALTAGPAYEDGQHVASDELGAAGQLGVALG